MDKQQSIYLIMIALLLIIGLLSFINSNYFKVSKIEITGNNLLSDNDIIDFCDLDGDINIFKIDREKLAHQLLQLPQIKGAAVNRDLPQKLTIKINERRPVAIVGMQPSYQIIDSKGWILDTTKNLAYWDLPLITGVTVINQERKVKLTDKFATAIRYLSLLPNQVLKGLSELNISKIGNIEVFLVKGGIVKLGRTFDLNKKAKMFTSVYKDLKTRNLKVKYIDLRYDKNIVVKLKN